jgi:hypothetical protein
MLIFIKVKWYNVFMEYIFSSQLIFNYNYLNQAN